MAETLISPGVLARENDQSQVTSQPVQAGACIVGPTVLGSVNIPKLVTSYSEYLANFGSTFISGSDTYTYFTSISAYNYFNNGGTSLIVNRVASGSWTPATTTLSPIESEVESTTLISGSYNFSGSFVEGTARGGESGTFRATGSIDGVVTDGTIFNVIRNQQNGKLYTGASSAVGDASSIAFKFAAGTNPQDLLPNDSKLVPINGNGNGINATATVTTGAPIGVTGRAEIATVTITPAALGTGYAAGETLSITAGSLGSGMVKLQSKAPSTSPVGGGVASGTSTITDGLGTPASLKYVITAGGSEGVPATTGTGGGSFDLAWAKNGQLIANAAFAIGGTPIAGATADITASDLTLAQIGTTNQGVGGTFSVLSDVSGNITTVLCTDATGTSGWQTNSVITITTALLEALPGTPFGSSLTGGNATRTLTTANIATAVTGITPSADFAEGFQAGNILTIQGPNVGGVSSFPTDVVFTFVDNDLENGSVATSTALVTTTTAGNSQDINNNLIIEPVSATVAIQDSDDDFAVGQVVSVPAANIGTPTLPPSIGSADVQFTLVGADIVDQESFVLETLTEGTIMNSGLTEGNNGTLTNGTTDNIRWEIQGSNASTGTFSLIIRQGDDTSTAKRVLEIFPNISLDPQSSNYIERVVGNQTKVFNGAGTSDPYISTVGSFPNASRYVRVKEVALKTPNYFDNNGAFKPEFTSSLPDIGSGSFNGAEGELFSKTGFPIYTKANYYDSISDTNTQGMAASEMTVYTDAFNLLANKDDYSYNIITTPGLYYAASMMATPMNVLIQNTQTRGDAIAIVDLVSYAGGTVTTAKAQAASLDNSYAAAYWPWVQIADPDSRQLVWTVPSSMIPGVYAFNDRTSEAWFAPAGINRGGLNTVVQAQRKLTQTNRDDLYTGKVNPIATFPGKGVVVFGQKTLQSTASALDRINVRRLLIALKSYIVQIADNLVFEQNTAATRNNFLSQVNPYMESVQQRQGLYAFKVVMDASNNGPDVVDRNQMVGAIYVQPTKTAEFIYLDFNILPTGATFPS
jgi:hypothetical protein